MKNNNLILRLKADDKINIEWQNRLSKKKFNKLLPYLSSNCFHPPSRCFWDNSLSLVHLRWIIKTLILSFNIWFQKIEPIKV